MRDERWEKRKKYAYKKKMTTQKSDANKDSKGQKIMNSEAERHR